MPSVKKLNLSTSSLSSPLHIAAHTQVFLKLETDEKTLGGDCTIHIEPGACVSLAHSAQVHDGGSGAHTRVHLYLGENSKVFGLLQTAGQGAHISYHVHLQEPGAQAHLYGLTHLDHDQTCQQNYVIEHKAARCSSHILYKSVLDGSSRADLQVYVKVAENAHDNEALQYAHSLILSKRARQLTCPELRIYNNNVICKHGATVGALDENALLYLTSRNLSSSHARSLLIQAFLKDFVDHVSRVDSFLGSQLCL